MKHDIPKILVVRQQSQRCPNKILRPFIGEKSILDVCLEKYQGRKDVYVAGFEAEFQAKAEAYGVGFIQRDKASAYGEDAKTVHNYMEDLPFKYMCFIGVCAPFLKASTVDAAVSLFCERSDIKTLFGVKAVRDIIFKPDGSLMDQESGGLNSKYKKPSWIGTNSVYVFERERFLRQGIYWNYEPNDPYLFEISAEESPDIDTEEDFAVSKALYAYRFGSSAP